MLSHLRWGRPSSINSMITGTRICHLLSPEFHDCQARVAFTKILVKSLERKPHETTSPWKWKVKYSLSLSLYIYICIIYIYMFCAAVLCHAILRYIMLIAVTSSCRFNTMPTIFPKKKNKRPNEITGSSDTISWSC